MRRRRKNWLKKFTIGFRIRLAPWRKEMSLDVFCGDVDRCLTIFEGRLMSEWYGGGEGWEEEWWWWWWCKTMDGDGWRWCMMNLNLLRGVACSVGTRGLEIILASPTVHVPVASMEKAEGDMRKWVINELCGSFVSLGCCKFTKVWRFAHCLLLRLDNQPSKPRFFRVPMKAIITLGELSLKSPEPCLFNRYLACWRAAISWRWKGWIYNNTAWAIGPCTWVVD